MTEKNILQEILTLNFLEINNLILNLENELNIIPGYGNYIDKSPVNEDHKETATLDNSTTKIEIILNSILSDKKISVLKTIKNLLNLGLKESKEIVDNLPKILKETTDEKEANELKSSIEQAGGVVELNRL